MNITDTDIAQRWADGQADIAGIVAGITPTEDLYAFINPRLKLSMSEDCNTLYLDDYTDPAEVTPPPQRS